VSDAPQLLLAHHLKALKLPTFLREHDKLARRCAAEGVDHTAYLLRLAELELLERERRLVERRIREARFPAAKSLDSFDFAAIPAPARPTSPSGSGWLPAKRASPSASPPRPPWSTSSWRPGTSDVSYACTSSWRPTSC
jgi:hypothetical protein